MTPAARSGVSPIPARRTAPPKAARRRAPLRNDRALSVSACDGHSFASRSLHLNNIREDNMRRHSQGRAFALAAILTLSTIGVTRSVTAAELNPAALIFKSPDQLQWRDPTGAAGVNQAVLQGDP